MQDSAPPYRAPWYFQDGLVQTLLASTQHGGAWVRRGERSPLAPRLPALSWQDHIFAGAEGVPLAGRYCARPGRKARGTIIACYGITGTMQTCWYIHYLARKAFARGYDVVIYDWRGHGQSAALSVVPPSDGWRDGEDILHIARQAFELGCTAPAIPVGFSLGGQLVLWSLKAAHQLGDTAIAGACTVCPNLESSWSLAFLRTTVGGRLIEDALVRELCREVRLRIERYPEHVPEGILNRLKVIPDFDRELVIGYYGFPSVEEYYRQTSGLYLLENLHLPNLILYAADDPMFDPRIVGELERRSGKNSHTKLLLTNRGGHVGYIGLPTRFEDEFWALNRVLDFCDRVSS